MKSKFLLAATMSSFVLFASTTNIQAQEVDYAHLNKEEKQTFKENQYIKDSIKKGRALNLDFYNQYFFSDFGNYKKDLAKIKKEDLTLVGEVLFVVPNSAGNIIGAYVKVTDQYISNIVYIDFTAENKKENDKSPVKKYTVNQLEKLVGTKVEFSGSVNGFRSYSGGSNQLKDVPLIKLKTFKKITPKKAYSIEANKSLTYHKSALVEGNIAVELKNKKNNDIYIILLEDESQLKKIKTAYQSGKPKKIEKLYYKGSYVDLNKSTTKKRVKVHVYDKKSMNISKNLTNVW